METKTATTPWCSKMPTSPIRWHWYAEDETGHLRFWFCHEGLGDFDFNYDTDTIRLVLSNKPFEGSIRATVDDNVSSNIDCMLTELRLDDDNAVYWKPELRTEGEESDEK